MHMFNGENVLVTIGSKQVHWIVCWAIKNSRMGNGAIRLSHDLKASILPPISLLYVGGWEGG